MIAERTAGILLAALVAAADARHPADWSLVVSLMSPDAAVRAKAGKAILASRELSLAAGLMDASFFAPPEAVPDVLATLSALLREPSLERYRDAVAAVGRHEEIAPGPGYVSFKASLYAKIHPDFTAILRTGVPRTIRAEEVVFGGVVPRGIPALRIPRTVPASEAFWLADDEIVFGAAVAGEARAYPERILDWHEIVNDVLGGRTVTLAWDPLCDAAILYETTLGEGETWTFASSGLLYRSNKLMLDEQSGNLWSQMTGEPVWGPQAGSGKRLPSLPLVATTWKEWRTRHPGSRVLSLATGTTRDYRPGAAYGAYAESPGPMFPVWVPPPPGLAPKEPLVVVQASGTLRAYPIALLRRVPLLEDTIGETPVLIVAGAAAGEVRVYAPEARHLVRKGGALRDPASGETFTEKEDALFGDAGSKLPRLPSHGLYAFALRALLPEATLFSQRTSP
ncbi:MAG: DUF3179 domain-containing protein [Acidithiobacillales bacterium]